MSPSDLPVGSLTLDDLPPLKETLAAAGITARKSFGQHFLLDLNITRKIARLADIVPGETVIEIGPGPGGLTRALLEAGAHVIAVEKDARFVPLLQDLADRAPGRLEVLNEDALTVALPPGAPIVANLPYNVGTPLLIGWLTEPLRPRSMTLMFQKEVADRIVAGPSSKSYGRLSVLSQALCEARIVMDLPARAFTPPPPQGPGSARSHSRPGLWPGTPPPRPGSRSELARGSPPGRRPSPWPRSRRGQRRRTPA